MWVGQNDASVQHFELRWWSDRLPVLSAKRNSWVSIITTGRAQATEKRFTYCIIYKLAALRDGFWTRHECFLIHTRMVDLANDT